MGVYKGQIFCNTVCRNDIVKFECNTLKTKVFPFFILYGLGPFTCLNSELTSETINVCPTISRTPWMGDPVSQVTTYTEINTKHGGIQINNPC
jgi:hypothetical protein